MAKFSTPLTVAITTSLTTTPVIRLTDSVIGEIVVPAAASGLTSLTFYAGTTEDGEFVLAVEIPTSGVVTVAAARAYRLPVELCGAAFIKIVGNAAKTILINLKA